MTRAEKQDETVQIVDSRKRRLLRPNQTPVNDRL